MNEQRVVGIGYDPDADAAPVVMLKAAGNEARSLIDQAEREAVPTVRNPELVKQLYRIPVDQPIGRELFPVMAALLAHVLRLDQDAAAVYPSTVHPGVSEASATP